MKRFLLSLTLFIALTSSVFAYGRPSLNINYDASGEGRMMLEGHNLCDSNTFRIRIVDSLTGDSGWYTSARGNTEWAISRTREGDCKISMQLSKRVLIPGYVFQAVTYADGRRMHQLSKTIPCFVTD